MSKSQTKQIRLFTAHYRALGDKFAIPTVCLDCRKKGLVLMYNYGKHTMEAFCGAREDEKGQFIKGCDKASFAIPMTEEQYHIIVDDPHTTDYFFYLKVLQ